jgi:hypothetical protein
VTGDDAVTAPAPPLLRVVRGDPTPEELAAVVAVVAARAAGAAAEAAAHAGRRRSRWGDPARLVREPVRAQPGGWRASALPR